MTRRRIVFKDETGFLFMSPEFNGDKREFELFKQKDSCELDWDDIINMFAGINSIVKFNETLKAAFGKYHSCLGKDNEFQHGAIFIADMNDVSCDEIYMVYQGQIEKHVKKSRVKIIKTVTAEQIVDEALENITAGIASNSHGERKSDYLVFLEDDQGNTASLDITEEVAELEPEAKFYSIHLVDNVNADRNCELYSSENLSRDSFLTAVSEIIETTLNMIKDNENIEFCSDDDLENEPVSITFEKALPNGMSFVVKANDDPCFPGVNIYLKQPDGNEDYISFAEFNSEKPDGRQICVGVYAHNIDEPAYYASYHDDSGPSENV